jgi:hypothetical protein
MLKKTTYLLSILLFFQLTSCQDIIECVINRHPELPNKTLDIGNVGEFYFEEIRAEINNEPSDNRYFYYFSINGEVPEGLDIIFEHRSVYFEGRPQERGYYTFTVDLWVELGDNYYDECENRLNDCDGLCDDSTSKEYTIYIR